ncbi:hypothetical protein ACFQY8_07640 [Alloscardovia venturai]|uniref:N-acetyltransferase domain-containing protein n=1 Tax=Alloscardovia venturai TaxID=1769421 RepID=A0ABW2Y5T1_9BIFI
MSSDVLEYRLFSDFDLQDPFFDSLRKSYSGFDDWFNRKAAAGEKAYTVYEDSSIVAFLYLKEENDDDYSVVPILSGRRLKIGTFKVDFDHHSSIGKRLFAITMRTFAAGEYPYVYVTTFDAPHTQGLRHMFEQYGFERYGSKGEEEVWVKVRPAHIDHAVDVYKRYPFLDIQEDTRSIAFPLLSYGRKATFLPIYPLWHQRLFTSRLANESKTIIPDETRVNSIEKIYLTSISAVGVLRAGDVLLIYRTAPRGTVARYTAVVTAFCTVVEVKNIRDFKTFDEFKRYERGRSVFTEDELKNFYRTGKYPYILTFLENFSFHTPYPTRGQLLDAGLMNGEYPAGQLISSAQLRKIIELGGTGESFIID